MRLLNTIFNKATPSAKCPHSDPSGHFGRIGIVVALLLLCLATGFLYREGLLWLLKVWNGNSYSHGYFVPLFSLYFVWKQRERFHLLPITPAYPAAGIIILASVSLLLISRSSAFIQLETASLFLIIPGILLLVFGRQITRAALMPWLYLSFALPWFDLFLDRVQPYFQLITAILGTELLRLIYPVFRIDTYIHLPSIILDVAKACSGVVFFISVLAIGFPLVYITQRSWYRAALVLGIGIVITILANGLRVAMAGVMGVNFGPELLHGPAHIFQGWFVAWIGWAGIFLVNWLVIRRSDSTAPRLFERWRSRPLPFEQHQPTAGIVRNQIYLGSIILFICIAAVHFASPRPAALPAPLSSFPTQLANWVGTDDEWLGQESHFPGADEQLKRIYHPSQNVGAIYLHVAYFNEQTEKKRLISQFSRPLHKKSFELSLPGSTPDSIEKKVNLTSLMLNDIFYDVVFWYQFPDGEIVTDRNKARLTTLKNGIIKQHNNGAVVFIATRRTSSQTQTLKIVPPLITTFLETFDSTFTGLVP